MDENTQTCPQHYTSSLTDEVAALYYEQFLPFDLFLTCPSLSPSLSQRVFCVLSKVFLHHSAITVVYFGLPGFLSSRVFTTTVFAVSDGFVKLFQPNVL